MMTINAEFSLGLRRKLNSRTDISDIRGQSLTTKIRADVFELVSVSDSKMGPNYTQKHKSIMNFMNHAVQTADRGFQ